MSKISNESIFSKIKILNPNLESYPRFVESLRACKCRDADLYQSDFDFGAKRHHGVENKLQELDFAPMFRF